jgi:hypothetical protein
LKTYQIYYSSEALPKAWNQLLHHDIFLQTHYLKALETAAPSNIQLFYIAVYENDNLIGVAIIQRVKLYLEDMFRKAEVSCLKDFFQNMISKVLKGNILVVGNLTHTGQHALYFDDNKVNQKTFLKLVFDALNQLKIDIKTTQNKTIRMVLLKDFFTEDIRYSNKTIFDTHSLHKVLVQPNMIMSIKSNWKSIDDYVADLSKKYRDRYKRAKKKLGKIKRLELDLNTIESNSEELHRLYLNVSNNAKFNTFILPENHFFILKAQLQENFKVFGYYLDDKLVGFYTLILNGKELETYFLGYDSEHQYTNQLYLNMLYDMLKFGIEYQFSSIVYARTAMAIKSSVGAKAKPMVMYVKHTNGFMNAVLKQIFKLMDPTQDWEERHPFK